MEDPYFAILSMLKPKTRGITLMAAEVTGVQPTEIVAAGCLVREGIRTAEHITSPEKGDTLLAALMPGGLWVLAKMSK